MIHFTKWDGLPNEILQMILEKPGSDVSLGSVAWMMVNKNRYNIYQYFVYKAISIDFDSVNDKIVNNIIKSNFDSGQYVQRVNFKTFGEPNNLDQLNLDYDRLNLFMNNALMSNTSPYMAIGLVKDMTQLVGCTFQES